MTRKKYSKKQVKAEKSYSNPILQKPVEKPIVKNEVAFMNGKHKSCKGLVNLGNTCYFNSMMQMILNSPNFMDSLKMYCSTEQKVEVSLSSRKYELLLKVDDVSDVEKELIFLWEKEGSNVSPAVLRNALFKNDQFRYHFSGASEHDSHEAFIMVLNILKDAQVKRIRAAILDHFNCRGSTDKLSDTDKAIIKELGSMLEKQTLIHSYFGITIGSLLRCQNCADLRMRFDEVFHVSPTFFFGLVEEKSPVTANNPLPLKSAEQPQKKLTKHQLKKQRRLERKVQRNRKRGVNSVEHNETMEQDTGVPNDMNETDNSDKKLHDENDNGDNGDNGDNSQAIEEIEIELCDSGKIISVSREDLENCGDVQKAIENTVATTVKQFDPIMSRFLNSIRNRCEYGAQVDFCDDIDFGDSNNNGPISKTGSLLATDDEFSERSIPSVKSDCADEENYISDLLESDLHIGDEEGIVVMEKQEEFVNYVDNPPLADEDDESYNIDLIYELGSSSRSNDGVVEKIVDEKDIPEELVNEISVFQDNTFSALNDNIKVISTNEICGRSSLDLQGAFGCTMQSHQEHLSINGFERNFFLQETDLDRALTRFISPCDLSNVCCDNCSKSIANSKTDHEKVDIICHLPQILPIYISRFKQVNNNRSTNRIKNSSIYSFPFLLNLSPFCSQYSNIRNVLSPVVYRLFGIIEHIGSRINTGHYVSYVCLSSNSSSADPLIFYRHSTNILQEILRKHDDARDNDRDNNFEQVFDDDSSVTSSFINSDQYRWYRISDSRVEPVSSSSVFSCQAFMLFYSRLL